MARKLLLVCEAEQCADMAVDELSDGERQRVGIARALVTEPRLLLADGPASHLATSEQERIMLLLESVASEAEVAVLVTGSDEGALLHADPVLYLNDGRLLAPAEKVGKLYSLTTARSSRAAADA
jgi:ABC-type cobalamin/Fe3+-siderophores transport system ATPase subunit